MSRWIPAVACLAASCSAGPAPTQTAYGYGRQIVTTLQVTAPEYADANAQFPVAIRLQGDPNTTLRIADRFLFIEARGCDVISFAGTPARRLSEFVPQFKEWQGTDTDGWAPADESFTLDAQGRFETTAQVRAKSGDDLIRLPNNRGRGCALETWVGGLAHAALRVRID